MTDGYYAFQATGIYPLQSLVANPTPVLQIADPVMFEMASFFQQLLNTNLLPRFQDEATVCGLTHANLDNWVDGYAVAQTIVFPLNEQVLKVNDFKFPLLAIQPVSEEYTSWTLVNPATKRNFSVAWILPPLTTFQYNRMYPFFGLASKTLLTYGRQGYDPKVNPQGPSFWQKAGLSFGFMDGASYEPYEGIDKSDGKAFFPCVDLEMSFVERVQQPVPQNFETFTEIQNLQLDLVDGYNTSVPIVDFISAPIPPDITITNCSPATGIYGGNTLVVINGTGFDPNKGLSLTLDGSPAQMVVKSPTIIMAISGPSPQFPVATGSIGPAIITDSNNNQYSLPSGFAYASY